MSSCDDRFTMTRNAIALSVPVCTNRPLDQVDPAIRRVVIVIHGSSRNAADYFNCVEEAATLAGVSDTLVIAPRFLIGSDIQPMPADTLYFEDDGWKQGDHSSGTRPWSESSFGVVDEIITRVADRAVFPNLTSVVVAGHSAGGQFVNRYAGGTRIDQSLTANGYSFRYVIANPSTYLYMNDERPAPGSTTEFAVPTGTL